MKRFIGPLVSKEDLQKLQEEADKFNTIAIAVTNNRQCWIYRNNDFERLSGDVASQVADILNCSKEEAAMAIYERGNYHFKDEVEEEIIEEVVEEAPTEEALEEYVVHEEVVPNVLAQTDLTEEDLEEDDDFDEVEEDDSLEEVLEEVEDVNDKLEEIRNLLIENNNLLKEQNGLLALLTSKLEGMLI